jgi:hypothetical protein
LPGLRPRECRYFNYWLQQSWQFMNSLACFVSQVRIQLTKHFVVHLKDSTVQIKKECITFSDEKEGYHFFQRTNEYYFDSEKKNIIRCVTCYTRILLWFSEEKDHLTYLQTGSSRGCKQIWYCWSARSESDSLDWWEWSVATGVSDTIFALSFEDHFLAMSCRIARWLTPFELCSLLRLVFGNDKRVFMMTRGRSW